MPDENEREVIKKAMAYDLIRAFGQHPGKTWTAAELEALIDAYIRDSGQ